MYDGKGIKNTSVKFLKCPNCGAVIRNKGSWCEECLENFDDMVFKDKNYISSVSEITYYDINSLDKKEYKKLCFATDSSGIICIPTEKNGKYIEDYLEESFAIKGGQMVVDTVFGEEIYEQYGDYIYEPRTQYVGTIPSGNYFETYCCFNQYTKPIWFFPDGTVLMYDGSRPESKVSDEGRYIREGDLIRTDLTDKETGKKRTTIWLVAKGLLCSNAYVTDNSYAKVVALRNKTLPISGGNIFGVTISKEEFFKNYPCQWCNARQTFIEQDWEYTAIGQILVSGRCRKCNGFFVESGNPKEVKKIAYNGSEKNPYYRPSAGAIRYLDNSCPYCGAYQVRYAKWSDKQMSVAFWGLFSQKLHANYKCDSCGKMWE